MSAIDNPQPGSYEIRKQLACVLAGSEFVTKLKPAEVFKFLVEKALEGKAPTEQDIRNVVFPSPGYDPLGTHVRTTINTVRILLDEYYLSDGRYDPVVIALPKKFSKTAPRKEKGKSYPVVFSYNPLRQELGLFKLARRIMGQGAPADVQKALETFDKILHGQPQHLAARIAKVECLCLIALCIPNSRPRGEIVREAFGLASSLLEEDMGDAYRHLLIGVAMLCDNMWQGTLVSLTRAMLRDKEKTIDSLWFPFACLLLGRPRTARVYAYSILSARGDDYTAWAAYGFYLYFNREFQDAKITFLSLTRVDKHFWLANLGLTLVCLSLFDNTQDALRFYMLADELLGEEQPFMPALAVLASARAPGDLAALEASSPRFANLRSKLLEPDEPDRDWVQLALLDIDTDPASAISSLRMAAKYNHPLTLLLPFWPIFDSLELGPLLEELGLPPLGAE